MPARRPSEPAELEELLGEEDAGRAAAAWRQASVTARPKTRVPVASTWKTILWAFFFFEEGGLGGWAERREGRYHGFFGFEERGLVEFMMGSRGVGKMVGA